MNEKFFDDKTKSLISKNAKDDAEFREFTEFTIYRHLNKPECNIVGIIEHLWGQFQSYADPNFKHSMLLNKNSFREHFWEMYCGVGLLNSGFNIDTLENKGPDFHLGKMHNQEYYIECIAPGCGNEQNPDSLPKMPLGVFDLPHEKYELRLLSALKEKKEKFEKYIQKKVVKDSDCLIIAIANINLSQYGTLMNYPVSIINKILLGIGCLATNVNTNEVILLSKDNIKRKNNSIVLRGLFLKSNPQNIHITKEYEIISGVIYSNIDILNLEYPNNPERTFELVVNPNAKNKLSEEFCKHFSAI